MVQRRWLPAIFYSLSFIIVAVFFMVYAVRIICASYNLVRDFASSEPPVIPLVPAIVSFLMALFIYVVGLTDTYYGYRLACTEWSRRRHGLPDDILREVSSEGTFADA